jgi:hypothetical protein
MSMGMVNIENIKFFLSKIMSKAQDVTQVGPEKRRMIKLHRMVQMKSIRDLHSGLGNPFLDAILDRKGGLPIRKGDIMPPFFQSFTEVPCRISRTSPLPVAEKMEDLHFFKAHLRGVRLKEKIIIFNFFNLADLFF